MANICIVRHQGYIKSKMRFPYQHNYTLSYIYNPNTEQENLDIMNKALKKSDRKNTKK